MGSNNVSDLPVLKPGTEVTARFRGAFCLAKVTRVQPHVTVTVAFEDRSLGSATVDASDVVGNIRTKARVQVRMTQKRHRHTAGDSDSDGEEQGKKPKRTKHGEGVEEEGELRAAVIKKVTDKSLYTVDFEDGDVVTLRRSGILLNAADDTVASDSGSTSDGPQARKRKKSGSWGHEREAVYVCATEEWENDDPPRIAMVVPTHEVRPEMGVSYAGPNVVIRYFDTADYDVAPTDHLSPFSRDSPTYHRLTQQSSSYPKDPAVVAALGFIDTHTLPQHLNWPIVQPPQETRSTTLTAKRLSSTGSVSLTQHSPAPVHSPLPRPPSGPAAGGTSGDGSFIYPAGSWVDVLSYADGKIYKAQVIGHELRGAGRYGRGNGPLFPHYNIHYKGYSQKFNEWITEDQIQGMWQAKRKRHDEGSDSSTSEDDDQSDSSASSSSDSDASDGQRRGTKKRKNTRERSPAPPKKSPKPKESDANKSPYLQPPRSPKLSGAKKASPRKRQRTQSQSSFEGKTRTHASERPKSPNLGRKREQSPAPASLMSPVLKEPKLARVIPSFGKGVEEIKEPKKEKEKEKETPEKTTEKSEKATDKIEKPDKNTVSSTVNVLNKGKSRHLAPPTNRDSGPDNSGESSGSDEDDGQDSAPRPKHKSGKLKKRVRKDSGGITDGSRGRKRTYSTSSYEGGGRGGAGAGVLAPPLERLASVDEAAMYKYEVGAKVQAIAYYDGRLYKAKVIQRELRAAGRHCTKNSPLVPQYLVHYKGWSRKHDEWVTEGQVIDRAVDEDSSSHSSESPSSSSPEIGKQPMRRTKSGDIPGRQRGKGEGVPRTKTEEKGERRNEDAVTKEKEKEKQKERNSQLERTLESLFSDEEGVGLLGGVAGVKREEEMDGVKREKTEVKTDGEERRGQREEKERRKEARVKEEPGKETEGREREKNVEKTERKREEVSMLLKEQKRSSDAERSEDGGVKKHKRKTESERDEKVKKDSEREGSVGKGAKEERDENRKHGEERTKTAKCTHSPHLGLLSSPKQPLTPRMTFTPASEVGTEGRARTPKQEREREETKTERKREKEEREREKSPRVEREKGGVRERERSKSPRPVSEKVREAGKEQREKEKEKERECREKEREKERKEKGREEERQKALDKEREKEKEREHREREKEKERREKERELREKEKEKERAKKEREEKEKGVARKEKFEREEREQRERQEREREREKREKEREREKERARERSRSPMPEKERGKDSKKRDHKELLMPEGVLSGKEKEKDRLPVEEEKETGEKERRKEGYVERERERQRSRSRSPMPDRNLEREKENEKDEWEKKTEREEKEKEKEKRREEKEARREERERARSRSPMPEREKMEKEREETREEKEKRRAERKEEKRRRREERARLHDALSPHLSSPTSANVEKPAADERKKDDEISTEINKSPLVTPSANLQPPGPSSHRSPRPASQGKPSPRFSPKHTHTQETHAHLCPVPPVGSRLSPGGKTEKSPASPHRRDLEQPAISIDPSFADIDWTSTPHRSAFSPIKPPPTTTTVGISPAIPAPSSPPMTEQVSDFAPADIPREPENPQIPPVVFGTQNFDPPGEVPPMDNVEYGNFAGEIPLSSEIQPQEDGGNVVFSEIPSDAIVIDVPMDGNIYQQPAPAPKPITEPMIESPLVEGIPRVISGKIQWTADEILNGSEPVQWERTRAKISDLVPPEDFVEEVMEEGFVISGGYGGDTQIWQQQEGVYGQGENYGYDNQYYRERANSDPFPVKGRNSNIPESTEIYETAAPPGPITRFSSAPNPQARFSPVMAEVEPSMTVTATSSDDTPSRRESPDTLGPILSVFVTTRATSNVGPGPSPLNPNVRSSPSPVSMKEAKAPPLSPPVPPQPQPLMQETPTAHLAPPMSPALASPRAPSPVILSNPNSPSVVTTTTATTQPTNPLQMPSSPLLGIPSSPSLPTAHPYSHPLSGAFAQRSLSEESGGGSLGAGVELRDRANSTGSGTEAHADSKATPTLRGPMKRQGISFPVVVPRRKREKAAEAPDAASKE